MKVFVQATQPGTGKKKIRTQPTQPAQSQSWGIIISVLPLGMELSCHFTMRQLKPWANTTSEVTTSHLAPWAVLLRRDNSLHKILAEPSALCPQPGEEGPQMFAELGADSWNMSLLTSPRLCWMGSSMSQTQAWALALCSDDGTMRNTSSPSLWLYPYFILAMFMLRTGLQVSAEVQMAERRRLTLADLEFSTSAPTLMLRGQPSVLPGPGVPG